MCRYKNTCTTIGLLKPGMTIRYHDEELKIIKLLERKLRKIKMKLIEICEKETKQVDYFGIELTIDADINFLAADDDGFVYGYIREPEMDMRQRFWLPKQDCPSHAVIKVDLGNKDWKETLVEV